MRDQRPKAKGSSRRVLPPLHPEAEAALREQVDQAAAALQAGREPAAVQELLIPRPQDPVFDLHLIAALGTVTHPGVPALLAGVFGPLRDKARRKALKRALHHLKARGVPVPPEILPREEVTVGTTRRGATSALVSPVLGTGDSFVILEGPADILGGNFLVARINDREGFRECHLLTLKRQHQEEFWEQFRQQGLTQWVPAPSAYAVRLLEEAHRLSLQAATGAGRYATLRDKIYQHWGRPEEAPDLEQALPQVGPGEASRLLEQSSQLAALDPLFHSWIPTLEEITPWFDKIKEVHESPLVLSDQQRKVRVEGVVEEATRTLYAKESRPDWARRLRTMAYYLDLLARREDARIAMAAAADLAADRSLLTGENPFLRGLVQCALRLAWDLLEKPKEPGAPSGVVTPPTESLIIRR